MKRIEAVICSWLFVFAVLGQSSSIKTGAPAGQINQRSIDANGNAGLSPRDRAPMANVEDQAKALATALNLSEQQQARLKVILQFQQQQAQAVIYDRSLSQEQRMDKFRSLNEAFVSKIRDLLTDDQAKQFDLMTGRKNGNTEAKKIEVDPKSVASGKTDMASIPLPQPAVDLRAASYKFQVKFDNGGQQQSMTLSTTIRESKGTWIATDVVDEPNGQATDVSTLEKGSLILKRRSLKQGSVSVDIDFSSNRAEGNLIINGVQQPVMADLDGPLFADSAGWEEVIACLPLAVGYTTSFRNFDLQKHRPKLMQLKVTGVESVTVPAGTFESFRVEVTPTDGGPEKSTVWIANGSRKPVKINAVLGSSGRATMVAELVQ
jgi:hypothetical protein